MKHFVQDNYYEVVHDVQTTWGKLKRNPEWKEKVGIDLFARMFQIAPEVWSQFAWGSGLSSYDNLGESTQFVAFARNFMSMLDLAIETLGPDLEIVERELQQLGYRHVQYGVMPEHYPLMGKALLHSMEHFLGDEFNEKLHESWNSIFTFMSVTMMQGACQELVKIRDKYNRLVAQVAAEKKKEKAKALEPQNVSSTSSSREIYDGSSRSDASPVESPELKSPSKQGRRLSYHEFARWFNRKSR